MQRCADEREGEGGMGGRGEGKVEVEGDVMGRERRDR